MLFLALIHPKAASSPGHIMASYGNQEYIISCSYSIREQGKLSWKVSSRLLSSHWPELGHKPTLKLSLQEEKDAQDCSIYFEEKWIQGESFKEPIKYASYSHYLH